MLHLDPLKSLRDRLHFPVAFGPQTKEYTDKLEAEVLSLQAKVDAVLASLEAFHKFARCSWCQPHGTCLLVSVLEGVKQ